MCAEVCSIKGQAVQAGLLLTGIVKKNRIMPGLAKMRDGDRLCDGDFHSYNITGPLGREVLIDWLDASRQPMSVAATCCFGSAAEMASAGVPIPPAYLADLQRRRRGEI